MKPGDKIIVNVPGDWRCDSYEEMGVVEAASSDEVSEFLDVRSDSGLWRLRPGPYGWSRAEDIT